MKRNIFVFCIILLTTGLFFSSPAGAADWRFPLGFTYVNGFGDVVDLYKHNLEAEGFIVDTSWEVPVGISFQPYVQFDFGLRVGAGLGPIGAVISDEADFYDFPINVNGGYTFFPSANTSPYVRGGLMYHLTNGDYVEGSALGFFGGIGVEFLRNKPVGLGIEVSYDTTEIEFEKLESDYWDTHKTTEDIQPLGLMVSIFAVF